MNEGILKRYSVHSVNPKNTKYIVILIFILFI
jgi:hypothetical protein